MKTIFFAHQFDSDRNPKGRKDSVFWGFYPSLFVSKIAGGKDRTYFKVEVTPFEGPEEEAPYWAWWDAEKQEFRHVYYYKPMVQMCFPYELAIYEKQGAGKQMPVKVTIVETIPPETA